MNKIKAIYKNEVRLYYFSWLGWSSFIVINIIAAMGYLFGAVSYGNFQYFFSMLEMPFAWAVLITGARTLAKDKELGMFPFFFTSPVPLRSILAAKYLALFSVFAAAAGSLLFYAVLSSVFFNISMMSVASGLLGLLCVTALFSAIALFASSCADNTLISIVIGFGIWMGLYLIGALGAMIDPKLPIAGIIQNISYTKHYSNIISGVFELSDLVYFVAVPIIMIGFAESRILKQTAH